MGKSRRKIRKIKCGGNRMSNKLNKQTTNRHFRRTSRFQINEKISRPEPEVQYDEGGEIIPDGYKDVNIITSVRESIDEWSWNTEGKAIYHRKLDEKFMRK